MIQAMSQGQQHHLQLCLGVEALHLRVVLRQQASCKVQALLPAAALTYLVAVSHSNTFEHVDEAKQGAYLDTVTLQAARLRMWACFQKVTLVFVCFGGLQSALKVFNLAAPMHACMHGCHSLKYTIAHNACTLYVHGSKPLPYVPFPQVQLCLCSSAFPSHGTCFCYIRVAAYCLHASCMFR